MTPAMVCSVKLIFAGEKLKLFRSISICGVARSVAKFLPFRCNW